VPHGVPYWLAAPTGQTGGAPRAGGVSHKRFSCAPVTWHLTTPSAPTPHRGSTTTANAPKGNATPKPCWHSPAAASTSCGRCCATTSPINPPHVMPQRLDNFIENLFRDRDEAGALLGGNGVAARKVLSPRRISILAGREWAPQWNAGLDRVDDVAISHGGAPPIARRPAGRQASQRVA
jgi:hypothetical protein